ncbi:hypothetical protein AB0H43_20435 [Hamadaea sp. NPDC050747]|uniref:hypothetical protein n=1 Tax=Hamadaea sp. NPDC050747 TaxID=3155789 RepID=UPI0034104C91
MTMFWTVETQFRAESGWRLVGGIASEHLLHIVAEGPNPDPRRPGQPQIVEPPTDAQAAATLRLTNAEPPGPARFPLYIMKLIGPDGHELPSRGAGISWSGRIRGGQHPPSVLNALFETPLAGARLLAAALYDDGELMATGRLCSRRPWK